MSGSVFRKLCYANNANIQHKEIFLSMLITAVLLMAEQWKQLPHLWGNG
jgi:hypothetical protein